MDYIKRVQGFSPNARLFLLFSLLGSLGYGIWTVVFHLYLLRDLHSHAGFIGSLVAAEWLAHGAMAFFAGIIGDWLGRKRSFILSNCLGLFIIALMALITHETILMACGFGLGLSRAFHGVIGAPFIMENSRVEERAHLFGLSTTFHLLSTTIGSMLGGVLPGLFRSVVDDPIFASRLTLFSAIPLLAVALVPLSLIQERPPPSKTPVDLVQMLFLTNMVSRAVVAKMVLTTGILAAGIGFFSPFITVFFAQKFGATEAQIGTVYAAGSLSGAAASLFIPHLSNRFGRVRAAVGLQLLSVPLLFLIPLAPTFLLAAALYFVRDAIVNMSMPIRTMFAMEVVKSEERATTEGLRHMAFDLPLSPTARMAGSMMQQGEYLLPFLAASLLYALSSLLYYFFFRREETFAVDLPLKGRA